jgi:hypothetical protein
MRIIFGMFLSTLLMSQPGWHTIKDKTGSCQLSLPPNWTILSLPGHASSPDHMGTTLISGHRPYRPFSEETLRVLHPDTVFENSPKRSFYAKKASDATSVSYHVEVPGSANACVAEISATSSYSQDEIKKIALTLSAAK